jgi:hypothetical protein
MVVELYKPILYLHSHESHWPREASLQNDSCSAPLHYTQTPTTIQFITLYPPSPPPTAWFFQRLFHSDYEPMHTVSIAATNTVSFNFDDDKLVSVQLSDDVPLGADDIEWHPISHRPILYIAKSTHRVYPHPGVYPLGWFQRSDRCDSNTIRWDPSELVEL